MTPQPAFATLIGKKKVVLLWDLECTGLDAAANAIVSSCWITTDNTFRVSALHRPPPGKLVTRRAMEINKLDLDLCNEGMLFADFFWCVLAPYFRMFNKVYLVAHNGFSFDMKFVASAIHDAPKSALQSLQHVVCCDTLQAAREVTNTTGKLQTVYEMLCKDTSPPISQWHSAEADTEALRAVYVQLLARGVQLPERPFLSFFRNVQQ